MSMRSYILWVWIFSAVLWPRCSQASCVAVLRSAVTPLLMIPVVHVLKIVWVYLHLVQGSTLKCEELLTWAGKTAKCDWVIQKKVVLKVYKLLFLYSSKNYTLGRKKPQYYSLCNVFENTPSVLLRFCLGHLLFPLVEDKWLSFWQSQLVQIFLSMTTKVLAVVWVPTLTKWRSLHSVKSLVPEASG